MIVRGTLLVRMVALKAFFYPSAAYNLTTDTNEVKGGGFRKTTYTSKNSNLKPKYGKEKVILENWTLCLDKGIHYKTIVYR